jgi:cation transport regulator
MPYRNVSELPPAVREHLPPHAQAIYMKAFNHAWMQYADPEKRRKKRPREASAHSVAWAAVERLYEKSADGRWRQRSS